MCRWQVREEGLGDNGVVEVGGDRLACLMLTGELVGFVRCSSFCFLLGVFNN